MVADVTREEDCRRAVDEVSERHGRLDILVNNVGTTGTRPLEDVTGAEWDHVMGVNAKSVALMTRAAAPAL